MRTLLFMLAVLGAGQVNAQVSIIEILPKTVEKEVEILLENDTCVYTYQIEVLAEFENLQLLEHRSNNLTNALVYKLAGTPFKLRYVMPDENDEIQDPFIVLYRASTH